MKSGIYIYCNLINGKKYVGQSVNINKRIKEHFRDSEIEDVKYVIHKAIKKHSIENFYIIKIKYPKEMLNSMEKYYIELFNTFKGVGYNCTSGGDSDFNITEETRKKISEANMGCKNSFYGKHHSEETKQILRDSQTGTTHSNETKLKMSNSHKGKIFSVEWCMNIGNAQRGEKSPTFGIPKTPEMKKRISDTMKKKAQRGESSPNSKLTEVDVSKIRKLHLKGISAMKISIRFNVSRKSISNIINGKTWAHI